MAFATDLLHMSSMYYNYVLDLSEELHNYSEKLLPSVLRLKDFIDNNHEVRRLFECAFSEVPVQFPFDKDHSGNPQVRDYKIFLLLVNHILTFPPKYEKRYFVGLPISTIINWVVNTPSGSVLFLNEKLNEHFKYVLNCYSTFLKSPESRLYLTTDSQNGWFGAAASADCFDKDGNNIAVEELYECDASLPYFGFSSWDAYFTRNFRAGQRPVVDVEDEALIVNGCESVPYRVSRDVKIEDTFWLKGQNYSLKHMLQEDDSTLDYFTGGTVYQAYLSAMSYHRWHSPVNGRIQRTKTIDGAYFAACPDLGFDETGCESQAYMSEVATRSLIFIECNNPAIGLMCFMAVGMGEVSSCEVTCKAGDKVKKGDQLGMFHFGGSTYCMIFGPHVKLHFDWESNSICNLGIGTKIILLNKTIAKVMI